MSERISNRKGFVLVIVLCLCLVFVLIVVPLIVWSVREYSWTDRSYKSLRALNLADAGVELAMWEIAHNGASFTGWKGADPWTLTISSFSDGWGEVVGDIMIIVDSTSPGHYLVTSTGYVPNASNVIGKKTARVKIFPHSLLNNGIFGSDFVFITGNGIIDSYNASGGKYSMKNRGSNADVGTNGSLTMTSNAMIKGDVFVGAGGSIGSSVPSQTTGEVYYFGSDIDFEVSSVPTYLSALPSQGTFDVSDRADITLPSGYYHYQDITVSGNGRLIMSPNTEIYVEDAISVSENGTIVTQAGTKLYVGGNGAFAGNGIFNSTAVPMNLEIYGVGTGTRFDFSGESNFYGSLYAPASSVRLRGNADSYGAIVGDDVTIEGKGNFHYDESLSKNGPFQGHDFVYWQEV